MNDGSLKHKLMTLLVRQEERAMGFIRLIMYCLYLNIFQNLPYSERLENASQRHDTAFTMQGNKSNLQN